MADPDGFASMLIGWPAAGVLLDDHGLQVRRQLPDGLLGTLDEFGD